MTKKQSKVPATAETSPVTPMAGVRNVATVGDYSMTIAGDYGTAMAGDYSTATAGVEGVAKAGMEGTAMAGDYGTAIAGDCGTAMAGYYGVATAGDRGTAAVGPEGVAKAGNYGEIHIQWWDNEAHRYRTKIAYVGEDGIKPNTAYHLNDSHEFEECCAGACSPQVQAE